MRQRGFTLIEVLVAAGIFVIIMSIAFQSIRGAARQRDRIDESLSQFHGLQRAVQMLSRDLAQLQPRPVRDLLGNDKLPALMVGGAAEGIEFTTGGWSNPAGLPRGVLQRVGYEIEEDTLFRSRWPVLDRTQSSVPVRQPLLKGVLGMGMRFIDGRGETSEDWPPDTVGGGSLAALPRAVEFTLETEDYGLITRVIEVAQ